MSRNNARRKQQLFRLEYRDIFIFCKLWRQCLLFILPTVINKRNLRYKNLKMLQTAILNAINGYFVVLRLLLLKYFDVIEISQYQWLSIILAVERDAKHGNAREKLPTHLKLMHHKNKDFVFLFLSGCREKLKNNYLSSVAERCSAYPT